MVDRAFSFRPPPRRRAWLRWSPLLAMLALALWSFAIEPGWLAERRLELVSPRWTAPEITIAVAADLHVGAPHAGLAMLDRVVSGINAARPDLILLPGDFMINAIVGGEKVMPEVIADHLAKLSAPLGVFATLGNHDWWFDGPRVRRALEAKGIRVLDNEAATLSHRGYRFALLGIGDDMTDHVDVRRAMSGVEANLPGLVVVHDPATLPELPAGPALAFAGHTHGGQVALPFFGALITPGRAPRQHAYGWVDAGPVPAFVTSGVGTSILPIRFNRRPEYLIVRLRPAASLPPIVVPAPV
ncbi:MAG TPA: metallophosphoesterase [Rhodocyclaceae bacterium]|nr:metallophosphoesterase [Rhodocyclaceae bacterium]